MPWITLNHRTHLCPVPALNRESAGDEWACPDCGCVWRVRLAKGGPNKHILERTQDRQLKP